MGDKGKKNADKLNREKLVKKQEIQLKKGQGTHRAADDVKK